MGKSIIIASNTPSFITSEITKIRENLGIKQDNLTDQIVINVPEAKMSIGIEQIQSLKAWSRTKPYQSPGKLAIIERADLMTHEAQNAALKLLEEPNPSNNFILVTGNYSLLLPTVLSRCELIYDSQTKAETFKLDKFLEMDELDRFKFLEKFDKYKSAAEKNQAISEFLLSLLLYCRRQILEISGAGRGEAELKKWLNNITVVSTAKKMLDAKVPARSALDYLLINVNLS